MSTTLLESNLGVMVGPGILCPTIKAFFFSPLIARRILSPTLPTPVLLYTWIHFGGRWYGVFPKALLSTTRTRVSFCIAWRAPVILKCRWITVLLRWVKDKPNRLFKRAMWILVILPWFLRPGVAGPVSVGWHRLPSHPRSPSEVLRLLLCVLGAGELLVLLPACPPGTAVAESSREAGVMFQGWEQLAGTALPLVPWRT